MVNTKPEKDTRYPLWVGPSIGLDGCKKSRPHRVYFVSSCTLYSIRTSFFVLIVLHFAFCLYLQHNTNIHAPGGIRNRYPSRQAATDHTLDRAATVIAMIRSPDRTFLSESLYRLHHPGPFKLFSTHGNCECLRQKVQMSFLWTMARNCSHCFGTTRELAFVSCNSRESSCTHERTSQHQFNVACIHILLAGTLTNTHSGIKG
jgi:hypothetical protein